MQVSQASIDDAERVAREWPNGIHTCEELQRLEPGRRPCTCGRCVTLDACTCGWVAELGSHYRTCPWRMAHN